MNILVTGGSGFIGANFIKYMLSRYDYTIINLDLLTYAGSLSPFGDVLTRPNYHSVQGDIKDQELVNEIFQDYEIQAVINFASAESHVNKSTEDPLIFFKTNVLGTEILLEEATKHWKVNPLDRHCRKFRRNTKFIQISTDEVYGSLNKKGYYTEDYNLAPNSSYSASKASADMIVRAYHGTYGIPAMITRCSKNYGPYQYPEKLIPLFIEQALKDNPIPIYGDGKQVRDWIHVEDHCIAIDTVLHKGKNGEIYNIGGNNEKENIEIAKLILRILDKGEDLIEYIDSRLDYDSRYSIDNAKITQELGWAPSYTFEEGIKGTVDWYLKNVDWIKSVMYGEKVM